MSIILPTIVLGAILEFITVAGRLVYHWRSASVQHKLHLPRIHHSYVGAVLLLFYWWWPWDVASAFVASPWTLIVGAALIASDIFHHVLMLPLLARHDWDIGMVHHTTAHRYLYRILGILLIVIGLGALLTPFTPGSWLAIIGAGALLGTRRARVLFRTLLGKHLYTAFHIERWLAKKNNER